MVDFGVPGTKAKPIGCSVKYPITRTTTEGLDKNIWRKNGRSRVQKNATNQPLTSPLICWQRREFRLGFWCNCVSFLAKSPKNFCTSWLMLALGKSFRLFSDGDCEVVDGDIGDDYLVMVLQVAPNKIGWEPLNQLLNLEGWIIQINVPKNWQVSTQNKGTRMKGFYFGVSRVQRNIFGWNAN